MTTTPHTNHADPAAINILAQQIMLDTLRAEMAALQIILPGLPALQTPAPASDATADTAFDNMPV